MLRNVTNIIMTCLLLISTTGFVISKHYCGNELISIDLKSDADPCCEDGMCCNTETQFIQLDQDFLAIVSQTNQEQISASDLILTASEVEVSLPKSGFINSFNYTAPPPRCIGRRLALQQVFLL